MPDVPIYDLQAGNEEGQVPLRRLNNRLMKLPRNLKPHQVTEVNQRLKALGTMNLPIPKGPMPRNARMPRGPAADCPIISVWSAPADRSSVTDDLARSGPR